MIIETLKVLYMQYTRAKVLCTFETVMKSKKSCDHCLAVKEWCILMEIDGGLKWGLEKMEVTVGLSHHKWVRVESEVGGAEDEVMKVEGNIV